ncbi:acyltransferase family protein [Solimonas soli]|uniref:acyltransferase family protein n=1 Tax=Solimonas soli TaxID=413479 RepID=UPI000A039939|nr:acyltransferase [Solimonas soli]
MDRNLSVRLDFLRWIAAMMVFLAHYGHFAFPTVPQHRFAPFGFLGVAIFFVLSGYLIAFVSEHKHETFRDYFIARIVRLYSVYVPAIALTFILDFSGRQVDVSKYLEYVDPFSARALVDFIFVSSFLHENSFASIRWLSNGPMWTLAYEFWYYIIYGVHTYFRGRQRILLLGISLLISGWKIILLFPIWLAGVYLYRRQASVRRSLQNERYLILVASILLLIAIVMPPSFRAFIDIWGMGYQFLPAGQHCWFLFYYACVPSIVGIVCWCMLDKSDSLLRFRHIIQYFAGSSFSLYLFHVPIIVLFSAFGLFSINLAVTAISAVAIFAFTLLLALVTEHRKAFWRMLFEKLLPQVSYAKP